MLNREFPTVTHQENRVVWELLFIRTLSTVNGPDPPARRRVCGSNNNQQCFEEKKKQLVLRVNNARKGPGFSERYKFLKSNENCQEQCSYRCGVHNKYKKEEERGAKGEKEK